MKRSPYHEGGARAGARAGSRSSRSAVALRRRAAGYTSLGATFIALVAVSIGAAQAARSGAGSRGTSGFVQQQVLGPQTAAAPGAPATAPLRQHPRVIWRDSRSIGRPFAGSLVNATKLPVEGEHFLTWDPERNSSPSPAWRRYATDRLIRVILRVADEFARAHPDAPRLVIGDLSKPRGGRFRGRSGSLHASHQNGLDADIYYPRRDGRERAPGKVGHVDLALAQDLVDRFVRAGARYVFVGPRTPLRGPRRIVRPLPRHDNHIHVRLRRG